MLPSSSSAAVSAASASSASSSNSAANDDLVARAVDAGIASHAELPPRVRALLPASEWRLRCWSLLVRRGVAWGASAAARGCCGEREYYEALVKHYLEAKRVRRGNLVFLEMKGGEREEEEEEERKRRKKNESQNRKKLNNKKISPPGLPLPPLPLRLPRAPCHPSLLLCVDAERHPESREAVREPSELRGRGRLEDSWGREERVHLCGQRRRFFRFRFGHSAGIVG